MGNAVIVELRQTDGSTFAGDEKLRYVKSHVQAIDGLLSGGKFLYSLLPDAILNTKKKVGNIESDTTTATLLALAKAFVNNNEEALKGCYFIANDPVTVTISTNHEIGQQDDGETGTTQIDLEKGDHLFIDNLVESGGFLASATNVKIRSAVPSGNDVDGTKWININTNLGYTESGSGIWAQNFSVLDVLVTVASLPSTGNTVGDVYAIGYDTSDEGILMHYYDNRYVWSVINNSYPEAIGGATLGESKAGIMSADDARKLFNIDEGANLYVHPTFNPGNQDLSTIETIDQITFNNGHVSAITKQAIRLGNTSQSGLIRLATTEEGKAGTASDIAMTPAATKEAIGFFGGMKEYAYISTADAAGHPNGTFALIQVGTVAI